MYYTYLDTPIGPLLLAGDQHALHEIGFPEGPKRRRAKPDWELRDTVFSKVKSQLNQYFAGALQTFTLALQPSGTPFQLRVLDELKKIPYGTTISYREIAVRLGKPQATRAVGAANGRNPIPVIIPCHRVIGSNGKLTGFGGGLPTKAMLLKLERENCLATLQPASRFTQARIDSLQSSQEKSPSNKGFGSRSASSK